MNLVIKRRRNSAVPADRQLARQSNVIAAIVFKAGSQQALADQLGVSQAAVSKWMLRGWLPLQRAAQVEALYGIPRTLIADPRIVDLLATANSLMPQLAEAGA